MARLDTLLRECLKRLHASDWLIAYDFAGVGSLALYWLHSVAGSSRTILEARDLYSHAALRNALTALPDDMRIAAEDALSERGGFTSSKSVVYVACSALLRAEALCPDAASATDTLSEIDRRASPLIGVGCLGAIATDRLRRGVDRAVVGCALRENCEAVVVHVAELRDLASIAMREEHDDASLRDLQERMASMLMLWSVCDAARIIPDSLPHDLFPELELEKVERTSVRILLSKTAKGLP
mmetsp:Transcript_1687/g.4480  ORF Transcript_1687/g.4480 Transcript_1687/m.4480 type:complete len:241 (+) Transcript_1687:1786-2508(+)